MRYNKGVRGLKIGAIIVLALIVLLGLAGTGAYWYSQWRTSQEQEALDAFYTPPADVSGKPGTVIRSEPAADWDVTGAKATRILYITETPAGEPRVASGTVWIPESTAVGERKVVAWAHPTVGLGVSCAPSRNPASLNLTRDWIQQMASQGWVVTATDYAGLGTPPPYTYLEGGQESNDVVNSVRAARNLPDTAAGSQWAVFGHSQGGHAALWTALRAPRIAPDLTLVSAAAAAPAADLYASITQQWDQVVAWVIGPEIVVSWPDTYPRMADAPLVTAAGKSATESEALDCLMDSGIFGLVRQDVAGQRYFSANPYTDPVWRRALDAETPPPPPGSIPLLIAQGTADEVVLANSTARLQEQWCKAGSDLTMEWLGDVNHENAGKVSGPFVVDWMAERFEGRPTEPNCDIEPPVPPFTPSSDDPPAPAVR